MRALTLFITFYVTSIEIICHVNLDVLKSLVGSYIEPPAITGLLCNRNDFYPFLKLFSNNGIMTRVQNVDIFLDINFTQPLYDLYILDLKCNSSSYILKKANDYNLFAQPNRWILFFHETDRIGIRKHLEMIFKNISILTDSDVTTLMPDNLHNSYKINKIYKPDLSANIIIEEYAIWTPVSKYKILVDDVVAATRRKNLMGITINTCLVITHNDSLNHLLDKRDRHLDTIAKVNYVFMLHLSDFLNIKMNYSIQSTWGYKNDLGEWSGMIGELTRKEAEIGGTPLFFTIDRIEIIDYIAMTTPTKSKFVFRQPKLSYITNVFTLPFQTTVWIASVFLVVITALGLYFVLLWESHKLKIIEIPLQDNLEPSLSNVTFLAISAVCQQGSSVMPHTSPGRIIALCLFTSLMFLYTSYSANIVALLQSSSTSIQTLEDLLHSRLQVGVDDTVFNHFYFPNASEPTRKAIYRQKVAPPGQPEKYYSIEEGVKRMRQGLFAFHMETGAGYKIVGETFLEDEKCGLKEIQFLQVPDPWLAIKKNSSYKEILKIGLRKIYESGIQNREVSLLYTKKPECVSRGSSFVGVSIVDCYPAATILAGGFAVSIIILILEIFFRKTHT